MQQINNPFEFLQAIKQGQNPQQLMTLMIQQRMGNSPMGRNLLTYVQNQDTKSIENFARNYFTQRGLDFDKEFSIFKQKLGI